ncbi:MAG: benzoate/H(+) symporter BenE family transporter [Pseudorhodobacter sp.]|nr:benzoate/H(+) symporter BenE family transporter [Pseudorhodobacter sp.]
MRLSMISAALVAGLVGYGSTIALILAAAQAVGASPAQTASWVLAISIAKAAGAASLSLYAKTPVVLAWSTPGAALIAATSGLTMGQAVGAFVVTGLLIALTGALKPLGRLVAMIPDGIAAGMLAGVLLPFCLKGPEAALTLGWLALPMLAVFALVRLYNPALAVLAALTTGIVSAYVSGQASLPVLTLPLPHLTFIPPEFRSDVLLGLALPLYLVTMASQNLPGFATMRAAGYEPPVRPALMTTGLLSALAGLSGAHTISMPAITAAICLGPDVDPNPRTRWKVGLAYAAVWVLLGLLSPLILPLLHALPPQIMVLLVALALLGPLMGSLTGAYLSPTSRFAATITLAVTASGTAIFGIGAAFWGLVAGLAIYMLESHTRKSR